MQFSVFFIYSTSSSFYSFYVRFLVFFSFSLIHLFLLIFILFVFFRSDENIPIKYFIWRHLRLRKTKKKYEFSFLPFVSRALEQAIEEESYKTRHFHL